MGAFLYQNECLITGLPAKNHPSDRDAIEYEIEIGEIKRFVRLHNDSINWTESGSNWLTENQYILRGLFFNGKWFSEEDSPQRENNKFITIEDLKKFLLNQYYPKSPKEKLDNLLVYIMGRQRYEGENMQTHDQIFDNLKSASTQLFFENSAELIFYILTLEKENLIEIQSPSRDLEVDYSEINITYEGLEYAISLQEGDQFSTNAFVAMSFSYDLLHNYENGIAPALIQTGFTPQRVDQLHLESGITINDSIIALIKKCRFIIADFTGNSPGVYTEAGIGIGREMKVIYCCHEDHFDDVHFDMNHFPFIKYSTPEDLRVKLINKIEAWVL